MFNMVKNKISSIKSMFVNSIEEEERLLNNISSAVLMAEREYDDISFSLKNSIKKEQMLHVMVDICNNLIKNRLDHDNIKNIIYELIDILKIDGIYLTKYKNNTFTTIKEWKSVDYDYHLIFGKHFYDDYIKYHDNNDFHRCFEGDNTRECVFPIRINDTLWGTFNLVKIKNEIDEPNLCAVDGKRLCYWNEDQVFICSILSSVFSSHIKTYKLIDDLEQQNQIIDKTAKMINVFTWTKDVNGKYLWCSNSWRDLFLRTSIDVKGKYDSDIIKEYKESTGKRHTFYNICRLTDNHCIDNGKTCHYIKVGYISDDMYIFDVKKSPLYEDGKIVGVVSVARDDSLDKENVEKMLSFYKDKGIAKKLNKDISENGVVAYWIKTEDTNINVSEGVLPK